MQTRAGLPRTASKAARIHRARGAPIRLTKCLPSQTVTTAEVVSPTETIETPVAPVQPEPAAETNQQALERMMQESREVEERVVDVFNEEEFNEQLKLAGDKLVILEVNSETVCQTGENEAEIFWKLDQDRALIPCKNLKHAFQRCARESPQVVFLALQDVDSPEGQALCAKLGVEVFPTLQFWKSGAKLWEHRGVNNAEPTIGEGMLFYADSGANGSRPSEVVPDLKSKSDFEQFIACATPEDEKVLAVVDVSLTSATPCVRAFPAVVALARSFVGYVKFSRMIADASPEISQLSQQLNILEAPTFLFYRGGKEVSRFVGSSRGDLVGQVLQLQSAWGLPPPPQKQKPARASKRGRTSKPSPAEEPPRPRSHSEMADYFADKFTAQLVSAMERHISTIVLPAATKLVNAQASQHAFETTGSSLPLHLPPIATLDEDENKSANEAMHAQLTLLQHAYREAGIKAHAACVAKLAANLEELEEAMEDAFGGFADELLGALAQQEGVGEWDPLVMQRFENAFGIAAYRVKQQYRQKKTELEAQLLEASSSMVGESMAVTETMAAGVVASKTNTLSSVAETQASSGTSAGSAAMQTDTETLFAAETLPVTTTFAATQVDTQEASAQAELPSALVADKQSEATEATKQPTHPASTTQSRPVPATPADITQAMLSAPPSALPSAETTSTPPTAPSSTQAVAEHADAPAVSPTSSAVAEKAVASAHEVESSKLSTSTTATSAATTNSSALLSAEPRHASSSSSEDATTSVEASTSSQSATASSNESSIPSVQAPTPSQPQTPPTPAAVSNLFTKALATRPTPTSNAVPPKKRNSGVSKSTQQRPSAQQSTAQSPSSVQQSTAQQQQAPADKASPPSAPQSTAVPSIAQHSTAQQQAPADKAAAAKAKHSNSTKPASGRKQKKSSSAKKASKPKSS